MSNDKSARQPSLSRLGRQRRQFLSYSLEGIGAALLVPSSALSLNSHGSVSPGIQNAERASAAERFPYFQSVPVSYFHVTLKDNFWAPRQNISRSVTVPWATRNFDEAGGVIAYRQRPVGYTAKIRKGDSEVVKFLEALAAVIGERPEASIEGVARAWGREMATAQEPDGYWWFGWPDAKDESRRWRAVWWSHEDYAIGHYIESAIALHEATGDSVVYDSAVRAADNMASTLLGSDRAYAPGHAEIEQALMRLYGVTGDRKYLNLCGWLLGQRGHHEGRKSYGTFAQDHAPIERQRTIEGHAVRAAYLFNGVTEYVGATGHAGYREAVVSVWNDLVKRKMYLHGGSGTTIDGNEGYHSSPELIPPGSCYGESCAVVGNFQWAHSLFRLTGDASYIDVAERLLYNAFYASLSLSGDRFFYLNVIEQYRPTGRYAWNPVPCCPPNIVKLFSKVGGFFYSMDDKGIFVKHYGQSEAKIPFSQGVKLAQRGAFPWDGKIVLQVDPTEPTVFALRLRIPAWSDNFKVLVNGELLSVSPERGWLTIKREWIKGDTVDLDLPMEIKRVTMPAEFRRYKDRVALQRGPIVYCLEQEDMAPQVWNRTGAYFPRDSDLAAEHRPHLLGGVTVIRGNLRVPNGPEADITVPVTFIPYGVWNNRTPGIMRVWMPTRKVTLEEFDNQPPGKWTVE